MKIVLVGVGGYGVKSVEKVLPYHLEGKHQLVGVVDPLFKQSRVVEKIESAGIPIFDSLEQFFASKQADLVVISSPIQFHAQQSKIALENNCHVFCEKPACADLADGLELLKEAKKRNLQIGIGYQWTHSEPILQFKQDILDGRFGKPLRFKGITLWPRSLTYYGRNSWAGRVKDNQGRFVFDSPFQNATSHYLHLMFYLLGDRIESCDFIDSLEVDLCRANEIECFDTGVLRATTKSGVKLFYVASHAIENNSGPDFEFEFEKGVVHYVRESGGLSGTLKDGSEVQYPPVPNDNFAKLDVFIDSIINDKEHCCGIKAALGQVHCINQIHQAQKEISHFAANTIEKKIADDQTFLYVVGLNDELRACYSQEKMPYELNCQWARKTTVVKAADIQLP